MEYEYHPIANLFPLIEDTDFENLVADIKRNGLLEPIWLYQNKILDGRNRYLACLFCEIEPTFREYTGIDPVSFVMSMNLERRHLTPSQRACLAVDLLPFYEEAAKERQGTRTDIVEIIPQCWGKSRDMAAEKAHVNSRYVSDAVTVKEESPELFEEMRSGLIHMKEAMSEVKKNRRENEREKIADAGASVPMSDRWHIYHGDINDIALDKQYDFIITDPPYPKEYLHLYEVLAMRAKEWLKPGGLLIAMCGQSYLNEIYSMMDKHLTYYWTAAYMTPGQATSLWQRQVNTNWKPLLIYSIDEYTGKTFGDVFKSDDNDKDFHKWGQSVSGMSSIIKQICLPGQYILDPFCGAGTTGIAALDHGCFFDGIDIDIDNVNISKKRIDDTTTA